MVITQTLVSTLVFLGLLAVGWTMFRTAANGNVSSAGGIGGVGLFLTIGALTFWVHSFTALLSGALLTALIFLILRHTLLAPVRPDRDLVDRPLMDADVPPGLVAELVRVEQAKQAGASKEQLLHGPKPEPLTSPDEQEMLGDPRAGL